MSDTDESTKTSTSGFTFDITNMNMTLALLGIYLISYAFNGLLFKGDGANPDMFSNKDTTSEIMALFTVLIILAIYYATLAPKKQETALDDFGDWLMDYSMNPYSLMQLGIFIAVFYMAKYIMRIPVGGPTKAIALLIILGGLQFMKYILKVDVFQLFKTTKHDDSEKKDSSVKAETKEEVYNISNNLYSYQDATAVCKALGARLATYDEIEDAYNNGAEWTSYGWSSGQHAYFPTQKSTWNELQTVKGHEHDLGRPGVNGGYFDNPEIKFGANCYGVKPPMSDADKALMDAKKHRIYPQSEEDELLDRKVAFFQKHKDQMMVLSGYNNNKWSKV